VRVTVYEIDHENGRHITQAFAEGAEVVPVPMGPLLPDGRAAVFYGSLRGGYDLMLDCLAEGRPFFYIDHAYIGRGTYYRVGLNHRFRRVVKPDYTRLDALSVTCAPWRESRNPFGSVTVCPPAHDFDKSWFFAGDRWTERVLKSLSKHGAVETTVLYKPTDVRYRPGTPTLAQRMEQSTLFVTQESNVATDAVIAGVQVAVLGDHPARALMHSRVSSATYPKKPDRREWLASLAANQWTLQEMRRGVAAAALGITKG
jgi:hypothetical protein